MPPLLILFTIANLVFGTGAFVIGGILQPIASSLGVSVPAAGQAMTAYALATATLAPALLMATGGWPRRRALLFALALFTLGNAVCALANGLAALLAGRVLMGLGAMFTPLAAGITLALVEPAKRGRALAIVFLGISLSYAVGVPLGAWLAFRFGWRVPLWLVTGAGLGVALLLAWKLPRRIDAPGASFDGLAALWRRAPVRWTLALTLTYFVAIFCVFSYIGPVLQALGAASSERLSLTLALFGVSGAVGTVVGGWANDRFGAQRSLAVQLSTLAAMMALLPLTRGSYAALLAVLLVWGTAGFGMMAPQQTRLAIAAGPQTALALSLNTSMLYVGTAIGAALGGAAAPAVGFDRLAWVGVPFALAGLATLHLGRPAPRLATAAEKP
jgi:DHA1 family inner membrane transport protein